MLRALVLLLVLANAGYWAWSQGALAVLGLAPATQREPQRLAQQLRPEAIRLLGADEVRRIESAPAAATVAQAPRPVECQRAGLFDEKQAAALRSGLPTLLPAGSWQLESGVEPARWIIYMGKYPNADAVTRKKAELRQIGVTFEDVPIASLQPGLSLGGHETAEAANAELTRLSQRGVRTAKVVQERTELRGQFLRLPVIDEALRPRLDGIKPLLAGKPLRACP